MEEKYADKITAKSLLNYHDRGVTKLFDAILHANLPAQDYNMSQRRALSDFKDVIRENRKRHGRFTEH